MAVSGAAAGPNMGFHTSPLVAFALTIFNVRLGWWFPAGHKAKKATPTFDLTYLLKKMLGASSAKSAFLMISDGGHFENLGAYELVGRRCRIIIISDEDCDLKLIFEGLGNLIRICKVDHGGTEIDIDVRAIIEGKQTYALGTITYPIREGREPALLIYLKASMTETKVPKSCRTRPHIPTSSREHGQSVRCRGPVRELPHTGL